jgi:hypothetical protein
MGNATNTAHGATNHHALMDNAVQDVQSDTNSFDWLDG